MDTSLKALKLSLGGEDFEYDIPTRNVLSEKVSNNVPFQRFMAGLLPVFNQFPKEFANRLKARLENLGDLLLLINPTVTAVSTIASISVGLWKRNGISALAQAHIYHNAHLFPGSKRHDLFLLQVRFYFRN